MSDAPRAWQLLACQAMSWAICLGFLAFAAYSFQAGITKETVYVGTVGVWLGIYLLSSFAVSVVCILIIWWLAAMRNAVWRRCAATFAFAWAVTLLAYSAWHFVAQSSYLGSQG